MQIKRRKPEDAQTERFIIVSLITSENVCRSLRKAYQEYFFQTKTTKTISKWCFEFFDKYDTCPQQEIETILELNSKKGIIDPDLEEEIRKFLLQLSTEYDEWQNLNEQYYIELGYNYFKKRSFILLSEQIKDAASDNNLEEADKAYSSFTKIKEELSQARDLLTSDGVQDLQLSISNRPPHLFQLPGALGRMVGPIERESFIGILGREKVGKTYALMVFAIAAARQGLNVAMLETGDLTQDQLDTRFYSYFTKKVNKDKYVGKHKHPVLDCLLNQTCECEHAKVDSPVVIVDDRGKYKFIPDYKEEEIIESHVPCIECYKDRFLRYKKFKGSIWWEMKHVNKWSWREAERKAIRFKKRYKGRIITEAFPMQSVSASDIRNWCINKQKQEGFVPDVLIIDYPDILAPETQKDYRHQENEKWMILRRISQEFHNCVIVATQADANSYNKDTLQLSNYSEDKRKYGHVTHFFGINKTANEEELGCCRFSTLLLREDSVQVSKQVTLLQNLKIGHPMIASFFGRVPEL